MLKKIISITGRPGLYRIISNGRNNLIVEDIISGKRLPVGMRDQVVSLGDISMYTDNGDERLPVILEKLKEKEDGKPVDMKALSAEKDGARKLFAEILPDYDRDRVYESHIKKLFSWYNLLIEAGITDFAEAEEKEEEAENQPKEEGKE